LESTVCPLKPNCALFSEVDLLDALKFNIETYYCKRNFAKCARYKLHQQGLEVPLKLLPNDKICIQCEIKN